MFKAALAFPVVAVLLTGCRTFTPPSQVKEVEAGRVKIVSSDATRRLTYVVTQPDGSVRTASEPQPDVALSILASAALKGSMPGTFEGIDGSVSSDEDAIELAGRSTLVLIYRDMTFRAAEMYANGAIDKAEYLELFDRILETGGKLAEAGIKSAEARKIDAEAKMLNAQNAAPRQ